MVRPVSVLMVAQVRCEMRTVVEKARTSASHDDYDLSDDDRDPPGFHTVKTLTGLMDQWKTLPIGGGNRSTGGAFSRRCVY